MTLDVLFAIREQRIRIDLAKSYVGPIALPRRAIAPEPESAARLRALNILRELGHESAHENPRDACVCGQPKLQRSAQCRACQRKAGWNQPKCACGRVMALGLERCHRCIHSGRYLRKPAEACRRRAVQPSLLDRAS